MHNIIYKNRQKVAQEEKSASIQVAGKGLYAKLFLGQPLNRKWNASCIFGHVTLSLSLWSGVIQIRSTMNP